MLYYPQLTTGCLAQFPVAKRISARTVVSAMPGGDRFVATDTKHRFVEWDLDYSGLTDSESRVLEDFFVATRGPLARFVFPDPAGNLLARSEEFPLAPWQSDPLLAWTTGVPDPWGGTRASRAQNSAIAPQAVRQSVDLPGNYLLCVSFWARASAGATLTVRRTAGAVSHQSTVSPQSTWRRFEISAQVAGGAAPVSFALEIPAGNTVELFGAQVEAQPHASGYRRTYQTSELYPNSRFAQDQIQLTAQSYGSFAARVRIVSAWEG